MTRGRFPGCREKRPLLFCAHFLPYSGMNGPREQGVLEGKNIEMRLDSRRISSGIGRLPPVQTAVRFRCFKGPSCKRDLTQGAVMRQYAVPQAGKFHVIGLAEAAVTSHLPLGHGPSVTIEKMKNFDVIGD